MMVLGLTGNLASGKSTVLKAFKKKGVITFDADERVHNYYAKKGGLVYEGIKASFPQVLSNKTICRKKLANIVFSDKRKLAILEGIIHPFIEKDLAKWVNQAKKKKGLCIAEVPLLFEKNLEHYFDKTILVLTKRDVLISRIVNKYKFSKIQAKKRLSLYISTRDKMKRANFLIHNNLGLKELNKEVGLLWKKLKQNQNKKVQ